MKKINNLFEEAFAGNPKMVYIAVDIHGTVIKKGSDTEFFPCSKAVLKHLSNMENVTLIMHSGTSKEQRDLYAKLFKKEGVIFKYINENPDTENMQDPYADFDSKLYCNIGLDDKYGLDPELDWLSLYYHFKLCGRSTEASMSNVQDLNGEDVFVFRVLESGKGRSQLKLRTKSPEKLIVNKNNNHQIEIGEGLRFNFADLALADVYECGSISFGTYDKKESSFWSYFITKV